MLLLGEDINNTAEDMDFKNQMRYPLHQLQHQTPHQTEHQLQHQLQRGGYRPIINPFVETISDSLHEQDHELPSQLDNPYITADDRQLFVNPYMKSVARRQATYTGEYEVGDELVIPPNPDLALTNYILRRSQVFPQIATGSEDHEQYVGENQADVNIFRKARDNIQMKMRIANDPARFRETKNDTRTNMAQLLKTKKQQALYDTVVSQNTIDNRHITAFTACQPKSALSRALKDSSTTNDVTQPQHQTLLRTKPADMVRLQKKQEKDIQGSSSTTQSALEIGPQSSDKEILLPQRVRNRHGQIQTQLQLQSQEKDTEQGARSAVVMKNNKDDRLACRQDQSLRQIQGQGQEEIQGPQQLMRVMAKSQRQKQATNLPKINIPQVRAKKQEEIELAIKQYIHDFEAKRAQQLQLQLPQQQDTVRDKGSQESKDISLRPVAVSQFQHVKQKHETGLQAKNDESLMNTVFGLRKRNNVLTSGSVASLQQQTELRATERERLNQTLFSSYNHHRASIPLKKASTALPNDTTESVASLSVRNENNNNNEANHVPSQSQLLIRNDPVIDTITQNIVDPKRNITLHFPAKNNYTNESSSLKERIEPLTFQEDYLEHITVNLPSIYHLGSTPVIREGQQTSNGSYSHAQTQSQSQSQFQQSVYEREKEDSCSRQTTQLKNRTSLRKQQQQKRIQFQPSWK